MLRPFRNSRKRMRVDADHPPPTHDAVNARHRTVQVAARIVETAAGPAGDHVTQVYIPTTPTTRRTLKPRSAGARHRLVPHNRNPSSIDPNIGRLSGELAPFFTPLEPRRRTFSQPAALQQHPDIEARVGFDDQVVGHAGVVMVVAQTETANHECETKPRQGCQSRARPGQDHRTANPTCMTPLKLDLNMLR